MLENSIFVGNIIYNDLTKPIVKKEQAILYKTKTGGYVELDTLYTMSDLDDVNMVKLYGISNFSTLGKLVMPAFPFSSKNNYCELPVAEFVDSNTLISYYDLRQLRDEMIEQKIYGMK